MTGAVRSRSEERRTYSAPAPPAPYADPARPLPPEELDWLKALQDVLWRRTAPDRFGHRHMVENDRTCLSEEELDRVFRLIRGHRLVTSMGSGTFGFGYSMAVYGPAPSAPGIRERPEFLLCMTEHHLPHPDGLFDWPPGTHGEQKEMAWKLFSQFTHSPENAKMLEWHGMDPPRERGHYDY